MPNCAVYGCYNSNRKTKGTETKYYSFPGSEELQRKWLAACKRADGINLKHARVCSEHFSEECFFIHLKYTLLKYKPRNFRNLKHDAIPTLNLPASEQTEPTDRDPRVKKYDRKVLINRILTECIRSTNGTHIIDDSNVIRNGNSDRKGFHEQIKLLNEQMEEFGREECNAKRRSRNHKV